MSKDTFVHLHLFCISINNFIFIFYKNNFKVLDHWLGEQLSVATLKIDKCYYNVSLEDHRGSSKSTDKEPQWLFLDRPSGQESDVQSSTLWEIGTQPLWKPWIMITLKSLIVEYILKLTKVGIAPAYLPTLQKRLSCRRDNKRTCRFLLLSILPVPGVYKTDL